MSFINFLHFVEIRTKLASVMPLVIGTLFSLYRYGSFKPANVLVMFVSLLAFDMATTAINNYIDFKTATNKQGYNYEEHNAIVRYGMKESSALTIIFALLAIAISFGILLSMITDKVVLLMGILCFATGILYTFGPIPISRIPLGEIISGFFMGFIIIFLAVYIHVFDQDIVRLTYAGPTLTTSLNLRELLSIFLISIPSVVGISNIMLANNTCDVEDDILNKRYTLPHFIGRENALKLFKLLYSIGFLSILAAVVLKVAPWILLLTLMTKPIVDKHIRLFSVNPSKQKTFVLAVKNFAIVNGTVALFLSAAVFGKYILR